MIGTEVMTVAGSPKGRDGTLCGARKRQSEGTCTQVAGWGTDHVGTGRCKLHGGATRNQATAAQRRQIEDEARRILADLGTAEPVANPLLALQQLAGEVLAFKDALRSLVEKLTNVRYDGPIGEQIRGEVVVYERALDRCGRLLAEIARLNIDARMVEIGTRIAEAQGVIVVQALSAALDAAGVTGQARALAGAALARELRKHRAEESEADEPLAGEVVRANGSRS